MTAVIGLDKDTVIDIIKNVSNVEAVNFNSPRQTVISGRREFLEKATSLLKERGAKRIIPLEVAGPFHSSLFVEYGERFYLECIKDIEIKTPNIKFISSVKGKVIENPEEIRECLKTHMYSPVKWIEVVKTLEELGYDSILEVGTSNILNGLIRQTSERFKLLENALDTLRRM
jgi:[acyl-carrier-protein] S-malonyltransferase